MKTLLFCEVLLFLCFISMSEHCLLNFQLHTFFLFFKGSVRWVSDALFRFEFFAFDFKQLGFVGEHLDLIYVRKV